MWNFIKKILGASGAEDSPPKQEMWPRWPPTKGMDQTPLVLPPRPPISAPPPPPRWAKRPIDD